MKRLHLFEFEDLPWFPNVLRQCMTRYIATLHRLLDTPTILAPLLARALQASSTKRLVDLCSGAGGPMGPAADLLRKEYNFLNLELLLTDLYPNHAAAKALTEAGKQWATYRLTPMDAGAVDAELAGVRTLVCGLHHMPPVTARNILRDAWEKKQPICVLEISDNTSPRWLWWVAIPFGFVATFLLTPMVRPMTLTQLFFTYVIPVLPLCIAWDGAVSNARTYTEDDLRQLLSGMMSTDYAWEIDTHKTRRAPGSMLSLLGLPLHSTVAPG